MYDELVKRLRRCEQFRCRECEYEQVIGCRAKLNADAADAIEELDMITDNLNYLFKTEVPHWIPVMERLPDTMKDKSAYSGWSAEIAPSDDVLCYLGSEKRQTVAWYSHTYKEWTTVDENTVYKYGEVTHWMPLPTPPEEE